MVNRFGRAVVLPVSHVDTAVSAGCRWPDSTDWRSLNSDAATLRIPRIEPAAPRVGHRPVVVFGAGPSAGADVDGAYRLGVNVRPGGPRYDGVLALDEVYWRGMWEPRVGTAAFVKYTCEGPEGTARDWKGCVTSHRFWLPLHPLKSQQERHERADKHELLMSVEGAIKSVHVSAIAAVLVARELTTGPVILAGVDLTDGYARWQLPLFAALAKAIPDLYCHPDMGGPLRELWPAYGEVTCGAA